MKKLYPSGRILFVSLLFMFARPARASHLTAAELRYRWVSGLSYQVTVILYGDCSSTTGAFGTLPYATPKVCIYNGDTLITSTLLTVQAPDSGAELTYLCPDSAGHTTCTSLTYTIPGIKTFVYLDTVTLPYGSATWRLVYEGYNGPASAGGRTAAITNLFNPGSTIIQLTDTLNTMTSRGHNSNPPFLVGPIFAAAAYVPTCYNPDAADVFDTSTLLGEPHGDSLTYMLVTPTAAAGGGAAACDSPLTVTACTYVPGLDAWTTPSVQPISAATPIQCTSGSSFSFSETNGTLCFTGIWPQRATVVYNVEEYFHGVLVGTLQREMNIVVGEYPCVTALSAPDITPPATAVTVFPNPTSGLLTVTAGYPIDILEIIDVTGRGLITIRPSATVTTVDITALPSGIYFAKLNGQEVRRFVKE